MRMRYLGLGFVRNRDPWLFLDYGTRITILVESVQERLHIPGIESPIECCSKLRLRRMCDEVLGVVHVIECSWSHIVRNNYFLSGFSRYEDCGISFRHQQTVRSDRLMFYEESDLIVYVPWF